MHRLLWCPEVAPHPGPCPLRGTGDVLVQGPQASNLVGLSSAGKKDEFGTGFSLPPLDQNATGPAQGSLVRPQAEDPAAASHALESQSR